MGILNRLKSEMGFFGFRFSLMGLFLFCCSMMVVVVVAIDGSCDLSLMNEVRNNVTRDLYGIERELKILMTEKEVVLLDDEQKLDQIPLILHDFLSFKYQEAEKSLDAFGLLLSTYSGTNPTKPVYIPEAVVDFSKQALGLSTRAQISIQRLIQCTKNMTAINQIPLLDPFDPLGKQHGCSADGTKCQYSRCANGNKLPVCAVGFATGVTGGAHGSYYVVNRSDDNNPQNPSPDTAEELVSMKRLTNVVDVVFGDGVRLPAATSSSGGVTTALLNTPNMISFSL